MSWQPYVNPMLGPSQVGLISLGELPFGAPIYEPKPLFRHRGKMACMYADRREHSALPADWMFVEFQMHCKVHPQISTWPLFVSCCSGPSNTDNPPTKLCTIEQICAHGGFHNQTPNQWWRQVSCPTAAFPALTLHSSLAVLELYAAFP